MTDKLYPVHPGEVLLEEFIKPMNLSQNRLAIDIGVDARRIRSYLASALSLRIPPCASHASSETHLNSGWDCKPNTTSMLRR